MIVERMREFLKVKQSLNEEDPIKMYALQIISGDPYLFRLVKKKGEPIIECKIEPSADIEYADSQPNWFKVSIGESVYHISETSLKPEKIIMLVNDYLNFKIANGN